MRKIIIASAVLVLAPALAQAKEPVHPWCQAHKQGQHTPDNHKIPEDLILCQICVYQADHDLPESGEINNETCKYVRQQVMPKFETPGELTQCDPVKHGGKVACELFTRCVHAGTAPNRGGIAFAAPKPLTPEEQARAVAGHDAELGDAARRAAAAQVAFRGALEQNHLRIVETPTPAKHKPFYKKWWFWGLVGAGVAGGVVGGLWVAGAFAGSETVVIQTAGSAALVAP